VNRWVILRALGVTIPTNETRDRLPILVQNPFASVNALPGALTSLDARLPIGNNFPPHPTPDICPTQTIIPLIKNF
jgi:hypothetical protein